MREFKARVSLNEEDNVIIMEPIKKATGKTAETKVMVVRLLTLDEADREIREAMQDGCHTYERIHSRIRQRR